ncbi:MAG TPA: hypothetical protein VN803_15465, partial [Gemmatimonadales bacterium]|nr:hypothetical protein [Gemmatimonadales bacterium]
MRLRIRSIKPEMRQDERYARLTYPARELFNGLITMADDEGRFRALTSQIVGHIFPYDEERDAELYQRIREWVAEIKDSGMVLFYLAENVPYGAFRHWAKHQKINRPTPSDLPPPPSPKVVRENGLVRTEKGWRQAISLTDDSVSSHDSLSEFSLSPPAPRGSDPDPSVVRLCERLAARVRANDPKFDAAKAASQRWQTDMRRLLADRNGDESEVA